MALVLEILPSGNLKVFIPNLKTSSKIMKIYYGRLSEIGEHISLLA